MNPAQVAEIAALKRAALARLRPLIKESYTRADELRAVRKDENKAGELRTQEREIIQGHPLDLFITPRDLAARMVSLSDIWDGLTVLEPSAGTGRISEAIREAGHNPVCVELNWNAAKLLEQRGFNVTCTDFLEYTGNFDRVIMNPPFSKNQDVKHVRHAYDLLNEGGRLVAIMSAHSFFAQDRESKEFQDWLPGYGEELPAGSFKASGTMVNAYLVVIDK